MTKPSGVNSNSKQQNRNMALNSEQVIQITKEVMLGQPVTIKGKEAETVVKSVLKDMKFAKENGITLELPSEIQA